MIGPVETVWLSVNLVTLLVTIESLRDARRARTVVKRLNGRAREILADQNVRREIERIIKATILVAAVVLRIALRPGEPIVLTPTVALFMILPLVMMAGAVLDRRDRRRVLRLAELTEAHA